jgi:hypothetical protein
MSLEKAIASAVEPIVEDLVALEQRLKNVSLIPGPAGLDGTPGKDADPIEVADVLVSKYADALRGEKGLDGKDGQSGEPGRDADIDAVAKKLSEEHAEVLRGLPGADGAPGRDGVDADPTVVAARLKTDSSFIETVRGEKGDRGDAGSNGADGKDGLNGENGSDGVGIKSLLQDSDDRVTIVLDNDTEVHVDLPRGEKGERGDSGTDGLGIEVKSWEPGVYREGTFTMANLGQFFKAVRDTASEPGKSDDWARVGSFGFAWKGIKKEGVEYQDGDLYIDGGSTFLVINGKGRIFAQRGAAGAAGPAGKDGADAPRIVAAKFYENELSLVLSDGEIMTAEIDGLKALWRSEFYKNIVDVLAEQHAARMMRGAPLTEFRGYWSPATDYGVGDVVTNNNATWVCVKDPVLGLFDADNWTKIASIGGGSVSSSSSSSHRAESLPGFLPDDTIRNETFPVKHNRINIFRGSWADLNTTGKPGLQFVDDTGNGLDFSNNLFWDVAGLTDYSAGTLGPWALSDARAGVSNIAGAISAYGPVTAEAIYDHDYRLEIDTTKSTKTTILYEAWYVTTAGDQIYLMCKMTAPKKLYGVKFISASADVNWTATRD